ncbi:MAG: hypothetical protein N2312_05140 [Dictyoglomaceae bacterium]|nr:hypothetical protein [Dictyoglomaceae bacterium]
MPKEFLIKELPFERIFDSKVRNITLSFFDLSKYLNSPQNFDRFEFLEIKGENSHFTLLYSKESYIASSYIEMDNLILNQNALSHFPTTDKKLIINIFSIYNEEIVNSILALYYGEISYSSLDYEVLDISRFFDLLYEEKFTGILTFSGETKEYIFCNEGKGITLERGRIKELFPMKEFIHHIPDSLIPLLSNPKTKLTMFSFRKERNIKPLELKIIRLVSLEEYLNMAEYIKRLAGGKGLVIFERYFKPNLPKSEYLFNLDEFQREISKLIGKNLSFAIIKFIEEQLSLI